MNPTLIMTEPRIELVPARKLIGMRLTMSWVKNRTSELWQSFMQRRKEINNMLGTDLYSMQVYEPGYFDAFNPGKDFEKWAAVEVSDISTVPPGMESFTLQEALYAIFDFKGPSTDTSFFQYIFTTWLPKSDYVLDNRPHFELLGSKYKNADPESEEQIFIPVKEKR